MHDPDFCARLSVKRQVISREIDGNLRALASESVLVITRILKRNDLPALQLKAALAVLPIWMNARSFDIDERVEALEAAASAQEATLQTANEGIERVINLVMGEATQDPRRE